MRVLLMKFGMRPVAAAMALLGVLTMVGCSSNGSSSSGSNATATPTLSPGAGTYNASQTVTIADTTKGAVLYCTTDGTTPTSSSPQCSQPTTVSKTEFLQAIAVAPGQAPSVVASAGYTIDLNTVATPTFSPSGGTFAAAQTVTMSDATTGANIYYTVDGSLPTSNSTLYTIPVAVSQSETLSAIAAASGFNNSGVNSATFTIQPVLAAPSISNIAPTSANAGSGAFTLTVNGAGFLAGATVQWNGAALTTTYGSATQLMAAVPANLITNAGTANVTVAQSSGISATTAFTVNAVGPTIGSLSPASMTAGSAAFTLTINGTNFVSGATVNWNGTALTTTFVSATQLTAAVPANLIATAGTASVTVAEPLGTSPASTFTINPGPPTITTLAPTSATAGGAAFTLTVNGTNFVSGATVKWNSTALTTTFVSATQVTAAVPASLIATTGTASVTVTTTAGTSPASTFTISPAVPIITGFAPNSVSSGGPAFTLTVNGMNFVSGATVSWNSTALTTTFVSATQVTAMVPASLIASTGSASVSVTTPAGTSVVSAFAISAPNAPTIAMISPTSATAGGAAFTLTVDGTNFISGSVVSWNSTALTTTFASATQLTAAVPASLIATAGSATITVSGTAGSVSAAFVFTIDAATPTITSLSPAMAAPGGPAFTLTINGTNFDSTAVVDWSGTALTTTFVSATQVTAAVPASLIATAGSATVTVTDAGGTSSGAAFTIAPMLSGTVLSGTTPVSGATVQLYQAGQTGYGAGSASLLTSTVTTGTNGTFQLPVICPAAPGDQVYVVATGGSTGSSGPNTSLALMTALGSCNSPTFPTSITVNEVTTVASAYALSAFSSINSAGGIAVGSSSTNYQGLSNAFKTVGNLVNAGSGAALTFTPAYPTNLAGDPAVINNSTVPTARINTLADILNACTNGGSGCSTLFTQATPPATGSTAPADTLQAALDIAQNPGNNISGSSGLFSLATSAFTPALTAAPNDFTLALTFTGGGLGVSPALGGTLNNSGNVINAGMVIDAAGNIWVVGANGFAGTALVAEFNDQGAPLTGNITLDAAQANVAQFGGDLLTAIGADTPTAISIDPSNNLWIAAGKTLGEYGTSPTFTTLQSNVNTGPVGFGSPGVTADGSGDVWFFGNLSSGITGATPTGLEEYLPGGTQQLSSTGQGPAGNNGGYSTTLTQLLFDSMGNLWGGAMDSAHVYLINPANGFVTNTYPSPDIVTYNYTPLTADGAGNVYGCSTGAAGSSFTGTSLNVFNASTANAPVSTTALGNSGRGCGQQMVIDGLGHLFAITSLTVPGVVDEFTTTGALISPSAGFTGTSAAEPPTLNPDSNFLNPLTGAPEVETPTVPGAAIDGSGNLWLLNADTGSGTVPNGNVLVEFIGIAAPVVTPTSAQLVPSPTLVGKRP